MGREGVRVGLLNDQVIFIKKLESVISILDVTPRTGSIIAQRKWETLTRGIQLQCWV